MEKNFLSKVFLFILMGGVFYASFLVFSPFLVEILLAMILVSIFYTPYRKLVTLLRGRATLASLIMCSLVALLVIIPLANFLVFAGQKSVDSYNKISQLIESNEPVRAIFVKNSYEKFNFLGISEETVRSVLIELTKKSRDWITDGATSFIKGTTGFFISLVLVIFTMFFFFIDGERMLKQLMYWTPLPNKYDKEIFKKFKDVSYSTVVAAFLTALAQGLIGAIGFMIIGLPAFFAGIAMAFLSLIPYIGTAFVWFPVSIYLLVSGSIWQGVFLLAWGLLVVSWTDNIIRAYLIKEKAQVHPIFIIFSILGGIAVFGFWGVIFGPLIVALTVTVLHIYEMEYSDVLEK